MKKYEKPAIEIVEANLSAEYMLDQGNTSGWSEYSDRQSGAKRREDSDFEDEGW